MADRRSFGGGLSGAGLRDLLTTGIAGLESVPAVRAEPPAPVGRAPHVRETPPVAGMPPIDQFLYHGAAALAAARQLAERIAHATHPPDPAELEELQALLDLAGEG